MVHTLVGAGPLTIDIADQPIAAPEIMDVEVTNALRRLVGKGELPQDVAEAAIDVLCDQLSIERYSHVGLVRRAWELRQNLTAMDAVYIALAEALGCELATADAAHQTAPGVRCPVVFVAQ